jgi:hypothetical protein
MTIYRHEASERGLGYVVLTRVKESRPTLPKADMARAVTLAISVKII